MATMGRTAAAIILSSFAFSQGAPQTDIALASKSPLQLARYVESHTVVDWDALWSALGTRDPEVLYAPCGKGLENPCSTQVVTVSNPDQEILIVQGVLIRRNDIYLRYLRTANGDWQFAGERRAFVDDNFPRRHEVMRLDGKPFLKICSGHSQTGGALMQEVEDWFDLTQPGFEPVFSFTAQGSLSPFGLAVGRTVHAQAVAHEALGLETIDLNLDVHFVGPRLDIAAAYVGIYERPSGEKTFSLRLAYSGLDRHAAIPREDFEGLGGVDFSQLSNERLLFYAFPGLQKIASGSDEDAKQWLRSVLRYAGDTPEKRTLSELLAKH
jgi:hypothetical protein